MPPIVYEKGLGPAWALFAISENSGHHQPTKIVINKKCLRFARIYGSADSGPLQTASNKLAF